MPLINCKVELKLRWSKYCVLLVGGIDNLNANNDDNNQFIGINIKQKVIIKIQKTNSEFFHGSNFVGVNRLFVLAYSNEDAASKKFKAKWCYLPKGITDNYNVIFNRKNFYDQPIDSDIKRYEEIKNLTTRQGEDYTTGCLLDPEYVKWLYRLIPPNIRLYEDVFRLRLQKMSSRRL